MDTLCSSDVITRACLFIPYGKSGRVRQFWGRAGFRRNCVLFVPLGYVDIPKPPAVRIESVCSLSVAKDMGIGLNYDTLFPTAFLEKLIFTGFCRKSQLTREQFAPISHKSASFRQDSARLFNLAQIAIGWPVWSDFEIFCQEMFPVKQSNAAQAFSGHRQKN